MKTLKSLIDRSTSLLTTHGRNPWLTGALAAALLLAVPLTLALQYRANGPELAPPDPVRLVRTAPAQGQTEQSVLRLPGVVRASESTTLAFLHGGQLVERTVRRGEAVTAGQTLAILHNPALMPGLAAAEGQVAEINEQLVQLEREVRRLEDLYRRDLISTEELERATSRRNAARKSLDQAQARRNEAREQLEEAHLRAPFAGTVVDLKAEPGQFVTAGQPILSLAGNQGLDIELYLGSERTQQLQVGQSVTILPTGGKPSVAGSVRDIGLASPSQPATVVIGLNSGEFRHGQNVRVEFNDLQAHDLSVPLAAIIDPAANGARLFRVANGRAIEVPVTLGAIAAGKVVVTGPLAEGDPVVIAGQGQLLDNDPVRVLP